MSPSFPLAPLGSLHLGVVRLTLHHEVLRPQCSGRRRFDQPLWPALLPAAAGLPWRRRRGLRGGSSDFPRSHQWTHPSEVDVLGRISWG